jgi:hypothetical protein
MIIPFKIRTEYCYDIASEKGINQMIDSNILETKFRDIQMYCATFILKLSSCRTQLVRANYKSRTNCNFKTMLDAMEHSEVTLF